ncbi:unnamed protein product [Onchocerca flexuosa]|uniref:Clathrin_bdg domain-containing protein n=1 Tax=Onchocerca flexuosa TaxID=387005 RepID=A0A183HLD4_9BILA|nr:unnamed protein product [Onchocerca flexuosa]
MDLCDDSYIDPFAPFSVYSFDDMNESESCQPSNDMTKPSSSLLASNFYDQPPLTSDLQNVIDPSSVGNPLSDPAISSLNFPSNISRGTTIADETAPSSLQPPQGINTTINSQQFSSLPQPVRLTTDIASCRFAFI